jgi:CHRD domain
MTRYAIKRTFNRLAFMGVVIALLLVSCGSGQHPPTTNQPPPVTSLTAGAALKHMPQGSALLTWTPNNQTLNVNVRLYGLAPNSTHPAQIHNGSCSKQGPVLYPLQNMVADAHGVADTTTQIKNVKNGIAASGWYVNVHNGPALSPADQFLALACGNISNPAPVTTSLQQVNTPLISAPGSSASESTHGSARLTLSKSTLTVTLTVSGMQPQSSHAAHIHAGSCQSQGAVVYPLNTIKADASGNATVTTAIQNVKTIPASGWYINIHNSTDLSTQTGFDPIACGNVQTTS